jgi:hypothetical protein
VSATPPGTAAAPLPSRWSAWRRPRWAAQRSTSDKRTGFLAYLGPGLITGAADDDPSGIATYSQVGAQFGYAMTWLMLFTWPLMAAIQEISARIGRGSIIRAGCCASSCCC